MPASSYRHSGRHLPVSTASAALTGGVLAYQEGLLGVVITSCDTGESTQLDAAGVHVITVPSGTVKGDWLYADLSGGDAASVSLIRSGMAGGETVIGLAISDRDSTTGKAEVLLASQPSYIYPSS